MDNSNFENQTTLGRTGLRVSRIGLTSGYGVPARAVERAFGEYGINYFYWDRRKPGMKSVLRSLVQSQRDRIVVAVQSYDHSGWLVRRSVEKALKTLGLDAVDILFMGWFNKMPNRRILDMTQKLKEQGKIRFLGITGHNRTFHGQLARDAESPFDVLQVRYNAAHRGAEQDIFADLPEARPGITTYTATRWGQLLKAKKMPPGKPPLTAADCYRFVLSHPAVDVCLAGPRTETEMEEGLAALKKGPLCEDELQRIRRIGDHVHG